jgi:hypothetical protein
LALINCIKRKNNVLFGASDVSFENGKAAHAWILSSGHIDDIEETEQACTTCIIRVR